MISYKKISDILKGESVFRALQAKRAIFKELIDSWDKVTTLPLATREKLAQNFLLEIPARIFIAKDQRTAKALIKLSDGLSIETVLMRHKSRNTICVSCQVGCSLGCVFCATGKAGFKRNLTSDEIVEQVLFWARWLKNNKQIILASSHGEIPRGCFVSKNGIRNDIVDKINNVVFMGMGEPFLNYDNVIEAIKIINDKDGLNIGSRHISVSTVGILDGIKRFTNEPLQVNPHTCVNFRKQVSTKKHSGVGVNLAISLHAPNDKLRSEIMPINKKYPLQKVLKETAEYIKKTNRKVMFEYVMIKDVNDSDECARELGVLLENFPKHLSMVNLIIYNKTGFFSPSSNERVKKFQQILIDGGVQALQRYHFGGDIKGACGQLAIK